MALLLNYHDVEKVLTWKKAIELVERVSVLEYENKTNMPSRLNADTSTGWFRVMPGVILGEGEWNVMGLKAMNLVKGKGLRYMILLFDSGSGELLAMMDAALITQIRTGAATAAAAKYMAPAAVHRVGVIGSGFEARGQLLALKEAIAFEEVCVYSPNAANRAKYADEMTKRIDRPVIAVDSAEAAVKDSEIIILATKTQNAVINGDWLREGATVLSIGSTRLDLRELDERSFARSSRLLVDHLEQVVDESGDVQAALKQGVLQKSAMVEMREVIGKGQTLRKDEQEILLYKSVGTALQDLAVAVEVYRMAKEKGIGVDLGEFPYLKGS